MIKNNQPLRILLIEDNDDDAQLILRILRKSNGFSNLIHRIVYSEPDLASALQEKWDIVFCDWKLPVLTPQRALEMVKTKYYNLPFVIVSGSVREDVAIELLKAGANDFISKDSLLSSPRKLSFVVRRELKQKKENALEQARSYDMTVEAWGKALELKDNYTHGHTLRVTDLALKLCYHLDLSHHDFKNVRWGSLLHDIGKIGIPDAILMKRDILTEEEFTIMKTHPERGYKMIYHIPKFDIASMILLCHHERWNGTGYPNKLNGTQIPYLARLFSVVDVYDALTSDRPYRPSWEKSKAIAFLLDERDITFDPVIIDAFVDMVGRG